MYQPIFTGEQVVVCERVVCLYTVPHAHVYRAALAVLLHAQPTLDNPTAARHLGKHEKWVRYWRRIRATEDSPLDDKPARGRKSAFSPAGRGHGHAVGLRAARSAR